MYEISKADWKLFRDKIGEWQESYMERLCKEYVSLLEGADIASERFWALEKRLKEDREKPGVMLELNKSMAIYDIASLVSDKVIELSDLNGFSPDLVSQVETIIRLRG